MAPAAMANGGSPFGMVSTYDASAGHWVVVAGAGSSGIWKYVEP